MRHAATTHIGWLCGVFLTVGVASRAAEPDIPAQGAPRALPALPRRPVALVLVPQEKKLVVANRSGTVVLIDTGSQAVVAELAVGQRLADLAGSADGKRLVVVDETANELIFLTRRAQTLTIAARAPVPPMPVGVTITPDGNRCAVASLWARRVTLFDLGGREPAPRQTGSVAIPFAPRRMLALP